MQKIMIVSSDGHATARMEDYRPYMPSRHHEKFDAFCELYREKGTKVFDERPLRARLDPDAYDEWQREVIDQDRLEGAWNADRRLVELEREGVVGEVLLPDFGLPFELYSPFVAAELKYPPRTDEEVDIGARAYNRWLVDYCNTAPERFAGMASVSFADVEAAISEIRWAKEAGLRGVMMPTFDANLPLFDSTFEPIWSTLEELGLPLNVHSAIAATTKSGIANPPLPHPACGVAVFRSMLEFGVHNVLSHLIWGGVLERHPGLTVVLTEQGSGWIISSLQSMDHSYHRSYLRRDIREVVKKPPSEYFASQCFLGSSLLSRPEVEARSEIGVDKMMFGVDYPHHEGTWMLGTQGYLRTIFGALGVPSQEMRKILGENLVKVYGFDGEVLQGLADRVGPSEEELLTPPTWDMEQRYARGDLHKPIGSYA